MLDFYGIDSKQYGVCHSDELYMFWNPYGFYNFTLNEVSDLGVFLISILSLYTSQSDKTMSESMTQAWVDFACTGKVLQFWSNADDEYLTGDPTPPGSSLGSWSPVTPDGHQYLRLDTEARMEMSQDFEDRVTFWRAIMEERPLP